MAVFGVFTLLLLFLAATESVAVDGFDLLDALGGNTEAPQIKPLTQTGEAPITLCGCPLAYSSCPLMPETVTTFNNHFLDGRERNVVSLMILAEIKVVKLFPAWHTTVMVCPNTPRDVAFLIDGSTSVRPQEFLQMKMFIEDIMSSLPENTHFSLLQFSSKFEVHFEFRHFHDNRNPGQLLSHVSQLRGSSYTASGIRKAVDLFDPRKGARNTAKKFLIVVTDGEKIGDPLEYAEVVEEANRAGITRFAIGAGPLFLSKTTQQELHAIASHPTSDHIFLVRHFTGLRDIQDRLKEKICAIHGPAIPIPGATEAPQSPDTCSSHSDPQVLRKLEQVLSGLDQVKTKLDVLAARQGKCGCAPPH